MVHRPNTTPIVQDRETLTFKALLDLNVAVYARVWRLFCVVYMALFGLKCHCDEISHFFFPFLFPRATYHHVRCPFAQKEKKIKKRLHSLKFRRSKSDIFRPPLLEIGSSWARYFGRNRKEESIYHWHLRQWKIPEIGIWEGQQQSLKLPLPNCQCC